MNDFLNGFSAKKPKYGNRKTILDGMVFDSKLEAKRYEQLRTLARVGEISELRRQVSFNIAVCGEKICRYVADFVYFMNGEIVVEDAKGVKTSTYQLKKRLMKAVLGIEITEWPGKKKDARKP